MLHILGFILKVLGILILTILGILLLVIGVILFVPISYEVSGEFPDDKSEMKISANVHWLFRLLRVKILFYKKELDGNIRIAWKKIPLKNEETSKKETKKKSKKKKTKKSVEQVADTKEEPKETLKEEVKEETEEESIEVETSQMEVEDEPSTKKNEKKKTESLIQKIKCTFNNICDKMKEVKAKKDKLQDFLKDPVLKSSLQRLKKELHWIVRFLRPKKIKAHLRFGFEDPSTTGLTLAGLSMIYPFTGDDMQIVPDFENKVLNGNIYIKGRLYLFYIAAFALALVVDKNVRVLVKKIMNKEFL